MNEHLNEKLSGNGKFPFLMLQQDPILYDPYEVDGQISMLDRDFQECLTLGFQRPMDPAVEGTVLLDGTKMKYVLKSMAITRGMWILGIYAAAALNDYDQTHILSLEGFADRNGNIMEPTTIQIHTSPRRVAEHSNPVHAAHEAIALQTAEEGIVLLKNENHTLPVSGTLLNIMGQGLHTFRYCEVGAGKINPRYFVSLKDAIEDNETCELNRELAEWFRFHQGPPSDSLLYEACEKSDTVFVVLSRTGGENLDNSTAKGEWNLTDEEEALMKAARHFFEKVVVVLNLPYPISPAFIEKYQVDAVVLSGLGGMFGGEALLNVLTGKCNPSGKLTDTWAKTYDSIPASKNFYNCAIDGPRLDADAAVWVKTVYEEDIYVGYRYFDTFCEEPAYPFGFGLSYTDFTYSPQKFCFDGEYLYGAVTVTNTGEMAGKEVIQIYIGKPDGRIETPLKELVEFEKTDLLLPGASQNLNFCIPVFRLDVYDEMKAAYILPCGAYRVYVGNSIQSAKEVFRFETAEEKILKQVKNRIAPPETVHTLTRRDPAGSFPKGEKSGIQEEYEISPKRKPDFPPLPRAFSSAARSKQRPTFAQVIADSDLAEAYVAGIPLEDCCRLTVCASPGWQMQGNGVAGSLGKVESCPDLPRFDVSDGNSGVRVNTPNIGFPASVVCASAFNKSLMEQVGTVLGEEAAAQNIDLLTAPGMNLHRHPLCGRQPEYFSEDPYLAGTMAGLFCKGVESAGVGSCFKHCIANNAETSRKRNHSILTERALRELYFKAFEYAMDVHKPVSIMTAYNAVNGYYSASDPEMIYGLFRDEYNYQGFVMTDWNSYDSCDITDMINGGNNWLAPGSVDDKFTKLLLEAVKNGIIPEEKLRESVTWLIRGMAAIQRLK